MLSNTLTVTDPTWDIAPLIIWSEIEVQIAVVLSCAAAFKTLAQRLFPRFMDGLASSLLRRIHGQKTAGHTHPHNGYATELPSRENIDGNTKEGRFEVAAVIERGGARG